MSIVLKDIEGLMPELSESNEDMVGFNAIIKSQGQKRIEKVWDREKLAKCLFDAVPQRMIPRCTWEEVQVKTGYYRDADAIISADQKEGIVMLRAEK